MQQADASPPEPAAAEAVQEQIAPTPPQEKPEVVAPPEQKVEIEAGDASPPSRSRKPSRRRSSRKSFAPDAKKPTDAPPAPRTTASPRAERQAPAASAASAGASAAAACLLPADGRAPICSASSNTRPPPRPRASRAPRGSASRSAEAVRCFPAGLGGSSGHSALDAETLAMVRRAQPFPAFPADEAGLDAVQRAGGVHTVS